MFSFFRNNNNQNLIIEKSFLDDVLNGLDDESIISHIGMAEMPKVAFYLYEKYHHKIELIPIENNDIMIRVGDVFNMANMSYLAVMLQFMDIQNGEIHLEGKFSCPTVVGENISYVVKNNGQRYTPNIYPSVNYVEGKPYERVDKFFITIPLEDENKIRFYNVVDNIECFYGKINSMRFVKAADNLKHQFWYKDGFIVTIQNGLIEVRKSSELELNKKEEIFQKEIMENIPLEGKRICYLRKRYYEEIKKKKKPIWIFMDRANQADDNAEVLFEYVQKKRDIDSYFVIDDKSKDYGRIKNIGNVLPLYSDEHLLKVLLADYIISSQSNGVIENPFWDLSEYVRDLYHNAKIVFLQHGVIKDDMSPTLNREETNFYGFVTSTKAEWQSIIDYKYNYKEENVWLTGLPRFDRLYHDEEKIILVIPSWRKGIMEQVWDEKNQNMKWEPKTGYKESSFFREYRALFKNKWIKWICKKEGYRIVFCPHPLLKELALEMVKGTHVECWMDNLDYRDIFARAELMITDFSSVAFDFAYLNKPIIYYQFDKEEFFGSHTYNKGYFNYETDGFGPVCYDIKTLKQTISHYIKNGMRLEDGYLNNIKNTFMYQDRNNCERVYLKLVHKML